MKQVFFTILILFLFSGMNSCGTNNTATTDNSTASTDNSTATTGTVIIYPLSYAYKYAGNVAGSATPNICYGTTSGVTTAPFYSTATHDLKDRLPSSKWYHAVYSRQGHKISPSWKSLWDGNIDMTLHVAEVIADNVSNSHAASGGTGFWSGTKSDGTFSGNNCRDWSSDNSSENGTWGSLLSKENSTWTDNGTDSCSVKKYLLCFLYD
jgi:hypothetical protein